MLSGRLERKAIVNDMSIQVATVNGSGSQSSNTVLLRSIFQMGVPVSGKNLFPSNIAGLPTWYTIRANKDGYIARKKEIDFLIAMNPETAQEDVMALAPGAAVLYDEPLKLSSAAQRPGLLRGSIRQACGDGLSGSQAAQAGQEHDLCRRGGADCSTSRWARWRRPSASSLRRRPKAADLNMAAAQAGYDYAAANLKKQDPFLHRANGQDRWEDHH